MSMNIGYGSFSAEHGVIWPIVNALNACFDIGLPVNDENALESLANGFASLSRTSSDHWRGFINHMCSS